MVQGYLAQESRRVNADSRKTLFKATAAFIILSAFLYILMKDSFDVNDPGNREVVLLMKITAGVMVAAVITGLLRTSRTAANGENLKLPFGEGTKEAVAKVINQEAAEGKILVEEYIYKTAEGKKPHGEKIVLTPSYVLLGGSRMKITAIPRDKVYWICAQVGQKGGPFMVQLMIFTEKKIFTMVGVDIEHVQRIAEKIDQYMPNVFSEYDSFILSYELEKLYTKNRKEFLEFYEKEKRKRA